MTEILGYDELVSMLRKAIDMIEAQNRRLSELDSISGDGDHGTTMLRAMKLVAKALDEDRGREMKGLLKAVGWNLLGVDGGATGPLFGTLFGGMSDYLTGDEPLQPTDAAGMFAAGLASLEKITKARVGDKTMMDALIPAVDALRASVSEGKGLVQSFEAARDAAAAGAEGTRAMVARIGRAKNLGEKTRGHPDPGATSVALIFEGFYEGLLSRG